MIKVANFLLIKVNKDVSLVLSEIRKSDMVVWSSSVYGPYQVVVYLESESEKKINQFTEMLRSAEGVSEIDARLVKIIPQDEELKGFSIKKDKVAVLLINVNYKEEKERVVTWNLRKIDGIKWARAMWGPTDIIAIVESDDLESMRNKICDEIKTLKGVATNSTYYCFTL